MLGVTWLAVLFSLASGLFWLVSACCCSGRSPYHGARNAHRRSVIAEKAPYTYERVSSPYGGTPPAGGGYSIDPTVVYNTGAGPEGLQTSHGSQGAYEPYRHV